ncbi:hypothetical protein LK07_30910 [Streptomyces pluripotens]|uniref:Uncharacterized protein n=1 Tax=Streptomyces pluripotens TaxID=1355015 RepID=A0A221P6G2_9ACTN|nr:MULTISPECIES: hypothetical protein [Streptomyces]ARP73463.1 hypothetical protein LK06_029715 [Streptomyces pluripotens]ASN27714.1 hypothetical protein LK07_30910 [Streptomyces pluripotens]KIE26880.1 hypothetical protein LK08_11660 [Streptomyces sp. MUSC 125]MCH0557384.1 hypothetical protein [Streptomyces sp. MUM 16J]
MAEQKSAPVLPAPLRSAASALRRVPGAETLSRAAEETLDKVGAVSPRSRRMAVYAGAGLLGAAGVVEWPVALTGAAVAWLTQARPAGHGDAAGAGPDRPHDIGTAALRSGTRAHGPAAAPHGPAPVAHGRAPTGGAQARHAAEAPRPRVSTGPLGPTARPERTTL